MYVTCEKCQTVFNLDPALVPPDGRKVRCTRCSHVWHVMPENESLADAEYAAASDDIFEDTSFQEMISQNMAAEMVSTEIAAEEPAPQVTPTEEKKPPKPVRSLPVFDHNPANMGANQFGTFVFLFLFFTSTLLLFFARTPIVSHFPAMAAAYSPFGIHISVPGEGLRISNLKAASKDDSINVSAAVDNISGTDKQYPSLNIEVRGPYGATLKEWDMTPGDGIIKSGESVPLNLTLDKAPKDSTSIEIKVTEP